MISVLIPNCKEEKIHNVVSETEKHIEDVQIIVCCDPGRKGKGWAIRQGLGVAEGEIICFIDGDMDIHPRMIKRLLPFLDDYDIVVGRKVHRNSIPRRILTVLSRLWVRSIFNVKYDTQTGIKVFKRWALPEWETDGFMFDAEILAKAYLAGRKIVEVPVEVVTTKKAKFSSILSCLKETIKVKQKLC